MTRVQREKYKMFQRLIGLIEKRMDGIFDGLPGFMEYYTPFKENYAKLGKVHSNQTVNLTGVAEQKRIAKGNLVVAACDLSKRLVAYGSSIKNNALMVNAHYAKTSLEQVSSFKTYDMCKGLLTLGREYVGVAGAYGISEELLNNLETLCGVYHGLIVSPKIAIKNRSSYTKQIGDLMRENMVLLGHMDILVALLERDFPEVYKMYCDSRTIGKIGFRKLSLKIKVVDTAGKGLAKVRVTCEALRLKKLTYKQGGLNLRRIKNGIYTFEFWRAGYASAQVVIAVTKGERKKVEVVLSGENMNKG